MVIALLLLYGDLRLMTISYNAFVIQRRGDKYYWQGIKRDKPNNLWTPDLSNAEICRRKPRLMKEMNAKAIRIKVTIEETYNGH
jgi:hypothetical protein